MLKARSSHLVPIEVVCTQLISPEHSVQHAISVANNRRLMKSLCHASPYIEAINVRLAGLITHEFPDPDGGLLLANALEEAVAAYVHSAQHDPRMEMHEAAYLRALVSRATTLVAFTVHGLQASGLSERWMPFAQPLFEWATTKLLERLVFSRREAVSREERCAARAMLASTLLSFDRAACMCEIVEASDVA